MTFKAGDTIVYKGVKYKVEGTINARIGESAWELCYIYRAIDSGVRFCRDAATVEDKYKRNNP